MDNNQYKFISRLPFFNQMFDNSKWHEPPINKRVETHLNTIDFSELIKDITDKMIEESRR